MINWSIYFRFFIRCIRFRRVALLFFEDNLFYSNFAILWYSRSLLLCFLFLDSSPRLRNDMEKIKGDGVRGSGIGEEETTDESKVCFWDNWCFCTVTVTTSLRSFNSFLESSLIFLSYRFCLFCSFSMYINPPSFLFVYGTLFVFRRLFLPILWKELGDMYRQQVSVNFCNIHYKSVKKLCQLEQCL